MENKYFKCEICNKQYKTIGNHIIQTHKDVISSTKEYYDKYIKKENEGICPVCGKPTKFITITRGYLVHCSAKCAQQDEQVRKKQEETNLERYDSKYSIATSSAKLKSKQTKKERYGNENYNNSQQMKQTKLDKYGEYYINLEKTKNTNLQKYGVTVASKLDSTKAKQKKTCQEKYGVDSYLQTLDAHIAFEEKYNTDHPMHVKEIKEKLKQTNLEKYNCECTFQVRNFRLKAIKTQRQNGNKSSLEDLLENYFIENSITYKQEYNLDERYPYFCDFYLPDTDLFIEINGYWTHGKHPFDKTNPEDLKKLNKWKKQADSGKKQYKNAIEVWTIKDVKKQCCAKKNNLNYIILWNKNDIETFIKTYKI